MEKYINDTSAALRDYLLHPQLIPNYPTLPPTPDLDLPLMVMSHDTDRRRDSNAPVGKRQLKEEYMFDTEDRQGFYRLREGGLFIII